MPWKEGDKYIKKPYVAIVTHSGSVIDLYNSTRLSGEDFSQKAEFLEEKGIEITEVKTIEELK